MGKVDNGIVSVNAYGVYSHITFPLIFKVFKPEGTLKAGEKYKTKIELASEIITELIEKGFSIELVLADSLYGESSEFIRKLNEYNLAYVVAIRSNYGVWMPSNQRVRANKWCKWEIIFCVYTMISLNSLAFLSLNQSRQTESNLQKSNSVDFSKHQQWNHEMEKSSQ